MATVALRHVVQQGPVVAALGRLAYEAARQRVQAGSAAACPTPGPERAAVVPPRPPALVRDYLRWAGGDPATYRGILPPHLFPQWGFPLLAETLVGIPHPLARVLNGGCRLEIAAPLPMGEPLHLSARLEGIDDDGRRVVLHQRLVTGTASAPDALVAHVFGIIPLSRRGEKPADGDRKARPAVPRDAREIGWWRAAPGDGLTFACLTGDFNPVHWVAPYARAAGFGGPILHGFATLARAVERLNRAVFAGDVTRLTGLDVRFTRPLRLPASVGVYVSDHQIAVGEAPGAPAYLTGTFETGGRAA